MKFFFLLLNFCLLILLILSLGKGDEDHEEEHSHPWEWAGIVHLTSGSSYRLSAEKVDGQYAERSMKMIIFPVSSPNEGGFHDIEEVVHEKWEETNATAVVEGGALPVEALLELEFNENRWISLYEVSVVSTGYYCIFTEHDPSEFEQSSHFLKSSMGEDVEVLFSEDCPLCYLPFTLPPFELSLGS